jgi:hypothetical protein
MSSQVLLHYPEVKEYFYQHYKLSISPYTGESMFARKTATHKMEIKQVHPIAYNNPLSKDKPTKPTPSDTPRPKPKKKKPNGKIPISIFDANQVKNSPFGHANFLCTDTNDNITQQFFSQTNPKTFALALQEERTVNHLETLQEICFTWRYWNEVYRPTRLADERRSETGTPLISPPNLLYWRLQEYIKHYCGYYKSRGDEEQTACQQTTTEQVVFHIT